jgi:hypothetical protein
LHRKEDTGASILNPLRYPKYEADSNKVDRALRDRSLAGIFHICELREEFGFVALNAFA